MLEITTHKNYLQKDETKNQFCFRSFITEEMNNEQLVQEIINYNSTITEADARAVLSVLGTLVPRFVAKGISVELPFGLIHTRAKGSCEKLTSSFIPGTGDNKISILFEMKDDVKKSIIGSAQYKQMDADFTGDPKIQSLAVVQDDTTESAVLTIQRGKMLRIHGRNLELDLTDERQGVFLGTADDAPRCKRYTRSGSNVIDVIIPDDAPLGTCRISVGTKPGVQRYKHDSLDDVVTITE
ncbi:MAG: DNA-binding domain-containing protein [Treponema sp.]